MEVEFNCIREIQITQEMKEVLIDTFLHNPLYGETIFQGDRDRLSSMINLCLLYHSRHGVIYSLRNCDNKIVALSMWSEPGSPVMDIRTLLAREFFFYTVKSAFIIGVKRLRRLANFVNISSKYHIKEPHYYLFMLSSIEKGCGRILFNRCLDMFDGKTFFWESLVAKDNHAYYKSFGAEMIGEEIIDGHSTAYFVLRPDQKRKDITRHP